MHLLHIEGSPRKQRSTSVDVAHSFLDRWRTSHPDGTVDAINVWETDLPPFDGPALDAKYAGLSGGTLGDDQRQVWATIGALAGRVRAADTLLISVPMWNFGVPYRLKHLIDVVSQKDMLFTVDTDGLHGLMSGKHAVIVAARGVRLGGDYPEADFDHQVAYLRTWCGMIGITDVEAITVEGTLEGSEADEASRVIGRREAARLADA